MDRWEEQPLPTAIFMFIKSVTRTIPEEDFASHWPQVWLVFQVALCDWPSKNSVSHFLGREGGVCSCLVETSCSELWSPGLPW